MLELNNEIGYISGLFDDINIDVLNTLEWIKTQCKKLVIGLYSDDLTLRLLDHPAKNNYETRKLFLMQLRNVDDVIEVSWENIDKKKTYEQIKFDICFCGSEYGLNYIKDELFFKEKGVELKILPDFKLNFRGSALKYALETACIDKNIVLFGTGKFFNTYMDLYGEQFPPVYAIDNDISKQGTQKRGIQIFGIEKLNEQSRRKPLVIVCAKDCSNMVEQLKKLPNIDFRTFYSVEDYAIYDEYSALLIDEAEYMQKAHELLMLLLCEFDKICKKYNLKYYLNDGSLIGAVRHHALIPWDDDADVSMFREDFEKLREIAEKEWKQGDYLFAPYDTVGKDVFHDFMTRLIYMKEDLPNGVFSISASKIRPELLNKMCLDIYILDNASVDIKKHQHQANKIKALYGLAMGHRAKIDFSDYKGQRKLIVLAIALLSTLGRIIPLRFIYTCYEKICKKYSQYNKDSGLVFESNAPLCCLLGRFKKSLFGNGVNISVYGHELSVPERFSDYLEQHGYHNFMQYPPANMRKPTHSLTSAKIMYQL